MTGIHFLSNTRTSLGSEFIFFGSDHLQRLFPYPRLSASVPLSATTLSVFENPWDAVSSFRSNVAAVTDQQCVPVPRLARLTH